MSEQVSIRWSFSGQAAIGDQGSDMDVTAFLDPQQERDLVIVGFGAAAQGDDIVMIELSLAHINSDGTVGNDGTAQKLRYGTTSVSSTISVSASGQEIAVGLGIGVTGGVVKSLVLYTRTLDAVSGLLGSDVHRHHAGDDPPSSGHYLEWYADASSFTESDLSATMLTGIGASVTSKNNSISAIAVQVGAIEIVTPSLAAKPSGTTRREITIDNVGLVLNAVIVADDAYRVIQGDDYFSNGFIRVDGALEKYANKKDWLNSNNYTLIQNPNGTSDNDTYWGVVTTHGSSVVVAFRGTDFFSMDDIAVDAGGLEIKTTGNGITYSSTYFAYEQVGYAGTVANVHKGFYTAYRSIANSVRDTVQGLFAHNAHYDHMVIIGHSLGGALAALCAIDLRQHSLGPKPTVITFGAPKPGDQACVNTFIDSVAASYAVVQPNDFVPSTPWTGVKQDRSTSPFVSLPSREVLVTDYWFPTAHMLRQYYYALKRAVPSTINTSLTPTAPITSLTVRIHTANAWGAGTDAWVNFSVLGSTFRPPVDSNSFQRNDLDSFELTQLYPGIPEGSTVADLYGTEFAIWIDPSVSDSLTWTNFTSPWKLDYVDIVVNGIVLTTLHFNLWLKPEYHDWITYKRIGVP